MKTINQKIAVSVQPFKGKVSFDKQTTTTIPLVDLCNWWCTSSHYCCIDLRIYSRYEENNMMMSLSRRDDTRFSNNPIDIPDVNESHETEEYVYEENN